jgi:hypothetical protein
MEPERAEEAMVMGSKSLKRMVGRVSIAAVALGFVFALNGCSNAVEDPPRAMFGTVAWSNGWDRICNDVDLSSKQPQHYGDEHLNKDCKQYDLAQQMRYHQPIYAESGKR